MSPHAPHPLHLQETRLHGTLSFPCTMYFASGEDVSSPPFVLKPHWHDAVEILHLVEGTYSCGFNMNSLRLQGETFCFVESGALHSMQARAPYIEEAVVFDPSLLLGTGIDEGTLQVMAPLSAGTLRLPLYIQAGHPAFGRIRTCFSQLRETFLASSIPREDQRLVQRPAAQLHIKAALLELFAILCEEDCVFTEERNPDPRLESLKEVMLYIQENYPSKIYLRDLADIMSMNEQYFCRFFKKALGKSPIAYIKEIRIQEVSLLLESSQESISSIAASCGFNNMGHFLTEFKKTMGCTPAQYRKRLSGEADD